MMANAVPPSQDLTNAMDAEIGWGGFWYGRWGGSPNTITASSALALPANYPGTYIITNAAATALTLAAPTAGAQSAGGEDFKCIEVYSTTAYAHTLTATGLLQTGTAAVNLATFAARPGAGLRLMAYNGYWLVLSSVGITFS